MAATVILVILTVLSPATPAAAEVAPGVTWSASINGTEVRAASGTQRIPLQGNGSASLIVRMQNVGTRPTSVRYVRLQGSVVNLQFYVFTQRVDMSVPAGGSDEREVDIDLLDLGRQATGLIPSEVVLLDARGNEVDSKPFTADVQGRANSVYGTFGVAVGLITLTLLAGALWRMISGTAHRNRWRRAMSFAAAGLGLGFTLTFTMSVLRWATPAGRLWATFLLLGAVCGFAAGYLSPTPVQDDAVEEAQGDLGLAWLDPDSDQAGEDDLSPVEPAGDGSPASSPGITEGRGADHTPP